MATKKFFGTFNEIQKQTYTPGAIYYDIETGGVFQDTPQGRIQSIDGVGTLIDDTVGTSEFSTPTQSAQLVISRKDLVTDDLIEEEEENDLESQSDIADAEEESTLVVSQANRNPVALNSLLAEKEGEIAWRTKYQLFKKRIYLYREYTANETLFEFSNIPYIEPNSANVVNFINRTANIRPQDIYPKGPGDQQIWFLNRNTPELRNKPVVVSSVLVFDRKPVHVLEQRKYGDIPSKFVEDQNKVDIILFKNVAIDYNWQNSDKILGDLIYDYKLTKLRELEANAFNGWSAEFVEPDLETEETYAIALSLTSNRIPSFIYEDQWSWPPKPVRTQPGDGEDGEDARNVFLTADKALTITYAEDGATPNPSGTIVFTATPQNFDNPQYSFNGGAFSSTNTFNFNIPANISGLIPAININVIAREVSDNSIQAFDTKTVSGSKPGNPGDAGPPGPTGPAGPLGPTAVFKGTWDPSATYINTTNQRDVVFRGSNYYILEGASSSANQDPLSGSPWTAFAFFQYIASQLSITEESIVRENITVGDTQKIIISGKAANNPYISIGQPLNALGFNQDGIYIDRTPSGLSRMSLQSPGNNFLKWDGAALDIIGDIGGTIGEIKVGNPPPPPPAPGNNQSGIRLSTTGFEAYKDGVRTVNITSGGDASFTGTLNSASGVIGGWTIAENTLTRQPQFSDGWTSGVVNLGSTLSITNSGAGANVRSQMSWSGINWFNAATNTPVAQISSSSTGGVFLSGVAGLTVQTGSGDLFLRSALAPNAIYVRGRDLSANTLLRNPNGTGGAAGATEVSSEVVKKDIQDLDINVVKQFIETIDIKEFKYKEDDSAGISLIIEDEQTDNIPYQDALFAKIQGQILYDTWEEIPSWLQEYKKTPTLTQREDGKYSFNPKMYNPNVLLAITVAFIKEQSREVKTSAEKIEKLENETQELEVLKNSIDIITQELNSHKVYWSESQENLKSYESILYSLKDSEQENKELLQVYNEEVAKTSKELEELKKDFEELKNAFDLLSKKVKEEI